MKYESPRIVSETDIELEEEILKGSAIAFEEASVETVGQEVVTIDADAFTSKWE